MEFSPNMKKVIDFISSYNETVYLEKLLIDYIKSQGISITKNSDGNFVCNKDSFNQDLLTDILFVWIYVHDNDLVRGVRDAGSSNRNFVTSDNAGLFTKVATMYKPYWNGYLIPSLELYEFIRDGYRTKEEVKLDEEREARSSEREINETRIAEERQERIKADKARKIANWLTILAVTISAVLGLLNTYKAFSKEESVVRVKSFPDTVKVMYYNPPKDTAFIRTNK